MCGCSNFVNNDERDIITQDELSREFDFTGNRPSIVEVGEDPSFDFTGNRPSVIEVGEDPAFDFMGDLDGNTGFDDFIGKKAKARRQERKMLKKGGTASTDAGTDAGTDTQVTKNQYESSSWLGNNWIYIVLGVAVVGGGYWYYKRRK